MITAAMISGLYFALAVFILKVIGQSSKNDSIPAKLDSDINHDENSYS